MLKTTFPDPNEKAGIKENQQTKRLIYPEFLKQNNKNFKQLLGKEKYKQKFQGFWKLIRQHCISQSMGHIESGFWDKYINKETKVNE